MSSNDNKLKKLERNISQLERISNYKQNWNGYGAEPISSNLIIKVVHILNNLEHQPLIYATANGSIQLEYDNEETEDYLEIELFEDGRIQLFTTMDNEHKSVAINEDEIQSIDEDEIQERVKEFMERRQE